jgi:hypothetical protein
MCKRSVAAPSKHFSVLAPTVGNSQRRTEKSGASLERCRAWHWQPTVHRNSRDSCIRFAGRADGKQTLQRFEIDALDNEADPLFVRQQDVSSRWEVSR